MASSNHNGKRYWKMAMVTETLSETWKPLSISSVAFQGQQRRQNSHELWMISNPAESNLSFGVELCPQMIWGWPNFQWFQVVRTIAILTGDAQAFKPLLPQHKLHLKLVPTHLLNQPAWECLRVYRPKYNGVYSSVDWETMITTCLVCLAIDNHNIFTTCNAAATAQITGSKLPSENQFRASYGFWPTEKK